MKVYNLGALDETLAWHSVLLRARYFVEKRKYKLETTFNKITRLDTEKFISECPVILSGRIQYHGLDYEDL